MNEKGDLLLLYFGVIDILQNYRLKKKLEHALKSTLVTRGSANTLALTFRDHRSFYRKKYPCAIQIIMVIGLSDFFRTKSFAKVMKTSHEDENLQLDDWSLPPPERRVGFEDPFGQVLNDNEM